jgi:phosphoribosylglycinamide formyltransferase 1
METILFQLMYYRMIEKPARQSDIETAFLISGSGTTAEAVIMACHEGTLSGINPAVVVSSRRDAQGIDRAEALGIPTEVVPYREYSDREEFDHDLLLVLERHGVELVSQNGWLVQTPDEVIETYPGHIINQHPGPLDNGRPDFGGKKMYGAAVTCARLAYLSNIAVMGVISSEDISTEATVHHVTENYDEGGIIRFDRLFFSDMIDPRSLVRMQYDNDFLRQITHRIQSKLLPIEHTLVQRVLQDFADGRAMSYFRCQRLVPDEYVTILDRSKKLAISLFPRG